MLCQLCEVFCIHQVFPKHPIIKYDKYSNKIELTYSIIGNKESTIVDPSWINSSFLFQPLEQLLSVAKQLDLDIIWPQSPE